MKKLILLFVLASGIIMTSCKKDNNNTSPQMLVEYLGFSANDTKAELLNNGYKQVSVSSDDEMGVGYTRNNELIIFYAENDIIRMISSLTPATTTTSEQVVAQMTTLSSLLKQSYAANDKQFDGELTPGNLSFSTEESLFNAIKEEPYNDLLLAQGEMPATYKGKAISTGYVFVRFEVDTKKNAYIGVLFSDEK